MRDYFLRYEIRRFWYSALCSHGLVLLGAVGYVVFLLRYREDAQVTQLFLPYGLILVALGTATGMSARVTRLLMKQHDRIERLEEELERLKQGAPSRTNPAEE